MKIKKNLATSLLALTTLASLLPAIALADPEQERNRAGYAPRISGFNVDEVPRLRPGVELNFGLSGTPGGWATLRIAGAARNLTLVEVDAGHYEGTYTISSRDKIAARSPVTANLRVGNQVTSEVLNESLQVGVGYHAGAAANGPKPVISRFNVVPDTELTAGNELRFSLLGTPGGKVDLAIAGVRGKVFLRENNNGEYEGTYNIRYADRINANSKVVAHLRIGERVTSATLSQSLLAAQRVEQTPRPCYNCGTVEAVNLVEVRGEGNYLGAIGGGVVGALIGSQVGGGSGRTAAQVAGALSGAYVGNRIEGNSRRAQHFEVLVRLQNGAAQTLSFANDPGYHVGDKVRLNNGVLSRQP